MSLRVEVPPYTVHELKNTTGTFAPYARLGKKNLAPYAFACFRKKNLAPFSDDRP